MQSRNPGDDEVEVTEEEIEQEYDKNGEPENYEPEQEKWDVGEVDLDSYHWAKAVRDTEELRVATFGAGCFWGTEKFFAKDFAKLHPDSIVASAVGYMNPVPNKHRNPRYREVCNGDTGHIEVAHIVYDKTKVRYEDLVKHFFTFHDPTQ